MQTFLQRLSLFVLIASGVGCASAEPPPKLASFSFRPAPAGVNRWLATPIAVELTSETEARAIEAADATYLGELGVSGGGRVCAGNVALLAAKYGATHFRVVTAGDELRVDVVLYRVERGHWSWLPEALRPAPPA